MLFWSSSNSVISAQACLYKPILRSSLWRRPTRRERRAPRYCPALPSAGPARTPSPGLQLCPARAPSPRAPALPSPGPARTPSPRLTAQPRRPGRAGRSPRCYGNRPGMPLAQPPRSPLRSACSADSSIVCRTVVFPSASSEIASPRRQKARHKEIEQGWKFKGEKENPLNLCFNCRGERRKIILASLSDSWWWRKGVIARFCWDLVIASWCILKLFTRRLAHPRDCGMVFIPAPSGCCQLTTVHII